MKTLRQPRPEPVFTVIEPSAAPKAPRPTPRKAPIGVVDQVREACKPKNRLATVMGFLLGGVVPFASYVVAHHEVSNEKALYAQLGTYLVLGGLLYSAKTVYEWGKRAFVSPAKALGFVVLLEGVMVASLTTWLSVIALGYLVVINGVATGCTLSVRPEE